MNKAEFIICLCMTLTAAVILLFSHYAAEHHAEIAEKEGWLWEKRKMMCNGLIPTPTVYILLRNKLLIRRSFLFTYREEEVLLYRMKDFSIHQSVLQTLFGAATINIKSIDVTMKDFNLVNIRGSREEIKKIKEQMSELADADRINHRSIELGGISMTKDSDGDGIPDAVDPDFRIENSIR